MIGVGSLVVCVDDRPCDCCGGRPPYALRAVYRVSQVIPSRSRVRDFNIALCGVNQNWRTPSGEMHNGHNPERFRPLNDSHDDAETISRIKSCQPSELAERASLKLAAWNGRGA